MSCRASVVVKNQCTLLTVSTRIHATFNILFFAVRSKRKWVIFFTRKSTNMRKKQKNLSVRHTVCKRLHLQQKCKVKITFNKSKAPWQFYVIRLYVRFNLINVFRGLGTVFHLACAGILEQSMETRHRVGIGLSYRPDIDSWAP
jgi:hypothetical protein